MSDIMSSDRFLAIGEDGYVIADDVVFMREKVFPNGIVSKTELGSLLALAERAPDGDVEWQEFFGEAAADFYLREEIPRGFITEAEFLDLKSQVTRYSDVVTPLVLSMLIELISRATATPPGMARFLNGQIKKQIANRKGEPSISYVDCAQIRAFLHAVSHHDNTPITQQEAALLFDLNDMTISSRNDPLWTDLFVKANVNYLMAELGYRAPSIEHALTQWQSPNDQSVEISSLFNKMISGGLEALRNAYEPVGDDRQPGNVFDEIVLNRNANTKMFANSGDEDDGEIVHKADWMAERIGRDGVLDNNERALIAFMNSINDELPEKLKALVCKAA